MTPLLIMFGFPYNVAIGTDLLYAAITKAGGMASHTKRKTVEWRIVGFLAAGSLPASLLTAQLLSSVFTDSSEYQSILTRSLGVMLVLTASVILLNGRLRKVPNGDSGHKKVGGIGYIRQHNDWVIFFTGIFLGVFVTLSSVGAGASTPRARTATASAAYCWYRYIPRCSPNPHCWAWTLLPTG